MSFGFSTGDFIAIIHRANKLRKDYVAAPKECQAILSDVDNLTIIIQDFKEDIERYAKNEGLTLAQKEHFSNNAKACEAVVVDIEHAVAKYVSTKTEHPTWKDRARWIGERVKWDSVEIDRLRNRLTSTLSLLSRSVDNINQKNRARVEIRQQRQEDKEVLEWLTPAVYNVDQSMSRKRRSDNTGQWLLQSSSYQRWMRSASSDVLFLRGDPGVGKTVLTSIIVDDLQCRYNVEGMAVCFYYCNYTRTSHEQSPGMIWRAILRQLGRCSGNLPSDLHDLYNAHKDGTEPDLVTVRKTVYAMASKFKRLYIVIDALDECPSIEGYQHILVSDLLEMYNSSKTSIKLLITSRRLPDIESKFASFKSLDIRASNEDISGYIEANIQPHYQPLYDNVKKQPGLLDEIISAIIEAADGIFLLAQLHIDSLKRKVTIGDLRRAIKALDKGSNGYMKAYDRTMQRISGQDEIGKIAINALMWVFYAERALTRTELLHALATRPGETFLDPEDIPEMDLVLSGCCGLMVLEPDTDIIRLVHRTTQEYLMTHGSEWFEAPHTQISDICVTYLAFKEVRSRSDLTEEAYQQQNAAFPLTDYASWHYQHHMNEREKPLTAEELVAIPEKVAANSQLTIQSAVPQYLESCLKYPGITGLHLVAYCGLTEIMPHFLDRYEINATDKSGNTPIAYAVDQNHAEAVQLLIQKGARLDYRYESGDTLLLHTMQHEVQHCSSTGDIKLQGISRALIEAGIDVNAEGPTGNTPISYAIDEYHVEAVQLLLDRGAQLDFRYKFGDTLLLRAMLREVQGSENIKTYTTTDHSTRTGISSVYNKTSISSALVKAGIDVNAGDSSGRTPLMLAGWTHNLSLIRLLIDRSANPLSKDNESRDTLLHILDRKKRWEIPDGFIELDYYGSTSRPSGELPKKWTIHEKRQSLALQVLLGHHDAPSINGEQGRKYLCIAIRNTDGWSSNLAKVFFDAGVRLTLEDAQQLLKFIASQSRRGYNVMRSKLEPMLEYFLESGIPMERILHGKLTLLDFVIIWADEVLLSKALARTSKIECCSDRSSRWSHLHWACKTGDMTKILLLVEAGFRDTLVVTSSLAELWTPMDIWYYYGYSLFVSGQTLDGRAFAIDLARGEMSVKRTSEQGITEIEWSSKRTIKEEPRLHYSARDLCIQCLTGLRNRNRYWCETCRRKDKEAYCYLCRHDVDDLHEGHEWNNLECTDLY